MKIALWLQPRDPSLAGRIIAALSWVAAGVTVVFAVVDSAVVGGRPDWPMTVLATTGIVLAGWGARRFGAAHFMLWVACPFAATFAIVALDFLTGDAGMTAQVFLFFPALYAGSQLRRQGAALVSATVVLAEVVITFGMLPFGVALEQASYMIAALVTTVVLLTLAGERQDRLVALLERQAAVDPLTGLVTRRVLDEAARSALSGAQGGGTGLILIDVDNFKDINDELGHPAGDEVLVQLAAVLISSSRETDVVSRLGGDEIALLLPGLTRTALLARADQIIAAVRGWPFVIEGRPVLVTISGGIAHAPTKAANLRSLYVQADAALYRAKKSGRNQICAPESAKPLLGPAPAGPEPVTSVGLDVPGGIRANRNEDEEDRARTIF